MRLKYLYTFTFILGISVLGLLTPPYFLIGLYGGFSIVICFALLASFLLFKGLLNFREKILWDWFNLVLLLAVSTFISQVININVLNGFNKVDQDFFHQIIRYGFISSLFGLPLLLWIPALVVLSFRFSPKNIQQKLITRKKELIPTKTRILLSLSLSAIVAFFIVQSNRIAEENEAKGIKDYERIMKPYKGKPETDKDSKDYTISPSGTQLKNQKPESKSIANPEEETSAKKETEVDTMVKAIAENMIKRECYGTNSAYEIHKNDLNFDGQNEILIFYWGTCFCGTGGCSTQIYQQSNDSLQLIGDFTLTRVPFYLKKEPNHNWKDIVFFSSGGGAKSTQRIYRFNDGKYELIQQKTSSNSLYNEFITKSDNDKNTERIFDDAYKKIYGKTFNQ